MDISDENATITESQKTQLLDFLRESHGKRGTIAGGSVWGRGSSDMKGACASALVAARLFPQAIRPLGVVDRVAAEAPDTLLLAEAFWMLEGYFVRTLGMHRVYNSAFMNMLHREKNGEYRTLIRNTLEYDPRILSRYVNFMSNPD